LEAYILDKTKENRAVGMRKEWRQTNVSQLVVDIETFVRDYNEAGNPCFRLGLRKNYRPTQTGYEYDTQPSSTTPSNNPSAHKAHCSVQPYPHQAQSLKVLHKHFETHNKAHIVQACGVGKALLSIFFLADIVRQTTNANGTSSAPLFVIGVPSLQLVQQMVNEIRRVFVSCPVLCVCGSPIQHQQDEPIRTTTNRTEIGKWNTAHAQSMRILVTTYASSGKVADSNIVADVLIGDECHHLVKFYRRQIAPPKDNPENDEETPDRSWLAFWKIQTRQSTKSLFLTATPTYADDPTSNSGLWGTMSDETLFGPRLHECDRSVKWAIANHCITDYSVVLMDHDANDLDRIIEWVFPDKLLIDDRFNTLFLAALVTLEAMVKYSEEDRCTHTLVYTNTIEEANAVDECIAEIIRRNIIPNLPKGIYHNALHSKSTKNIDDELRKFKQSPFGIVPCAYLFSEGFDMVELDAVTIASPMQAHVRIVQSVLRPNRIDKRKPHKKATVLLPTVDLDDAEYNTDKLENVKRLLDELHDEDDACEDKVVCDGGFTFTEPTEDRQSHQRQPIDISVLGVDNNESKLERFRIKRLRAGTLKLHTKRNKEYNWTRASNTRNGIQSVEKYNEMQRVHANAYSANPAEYFGNALCKGIWKGWTHFLGHDTHQLPTSLPEWQTACKAQRITTADEYNRYVDQQTHTAPAVLPHDPEDYATTIPSFGTFTSLSAELGKLSSGNEKRRGRRGR
jgi:predicted helicase